MNVDCFSIRSHVSFLLLKNKWVKLRIMMTSNWFLSITVHRWLTISFLSLLVSTIIISISQPEQQWDTIHNFDFFCNTMDSSPRHHHIQSSKIGAHPNVNVTAIDCYSDVLWNQSTSWHLPWGNGLRWWHFSNNLQWRMNDTNTQWLVCSDWHIFFHSTLFSPQIHLFGQNSKQWNMILNFIQSLL